MLFARASNPKINEISWISVFTSRALVSLDRNWLSLARREGCDDTRTFDGI